MYFVVLFRSQDSHIKDPKEISLEGDDDINAFSDNNYTLSLIYSFGIKFINSEIYHFVDQILVGQDPYIVVSFHEVRYLSMFDYLFLFIMYKICNQQFCLITGCEEYSML